MGFDGGKSIVDDYLREIRPLFVKLRTHQRTVNRPGEVCQLYQAGYEVGRYVSLERLVQESSETYYEALQAAGIGWHTDEHDITPWLDYLLGIVAAGYKEFESRLGTVAGRGSKREAIRQFVR